jgi:hypothetical protein
MSASTKASFVCACLLLVCGCSDPAARNEANPFFKRGMELTEKQQYVEAALAFRECLRRSPESQKAHLQLAMLCEDHLNDLPAAIVHFRAYLKTSQDDDMNDSVRQWLTRTERRYFDKLRVVYGNPASQPPVLGPRPPPVAPPPPPSISEAHAATVPSASAAAPPPSHREPPQITGFEPYVVKSGDSLTRIAKSQLGSEKFWKRIFDANRDVLPSENKLRVGQTLKIPHRQAGD